ncbi:hypothetical protein CDEF62S_04816 [Castellaniella defragrans]
MEDVLDHLERNMLEMRSVRGMKDKHQYFVNIANTRYALRKVFRIIEEQAKAQGLSLWNSILQALLQTDGSTEKRLRIKDLALRLDIPAGFASTLARTLLAKGCVEKLKSADDRRVSFIGLTDETLKTLYEIDEKVALKIASFTSDLSLEERREIDFVMMFYVGAVR